MSSRTIFINFETEQVVASKAQLEAEFKDQNAFTYQTTIAKPLANILAMSLMCQRPDDVVDKAEQLLAGTTP